MPGPGGPSRDMIEIGVPIEEIAARLSLHMCGRSDYLLEIFRDDLAIHELQGFGYEVDLGRVLDALGPLGGLIIQDGNNIPPGSPLANINAMMEAAEAGRPE
ncbi:MAG: hypothetical protein MUQ00_03190 [Candidatus Aminicenantes bacterium]|nr:hypothetical protein [Candidatus Aminicenantes bacterium]